MPDKIELYLENKLSQEDRAKFENEILLNPALLEEIEKRKELLKIISDQLSYSSMFTSKEDKALLTRKQEIEVEEDIIKFHSEYEVENYQHEEKLRNIIREVMNNKDNMVREISPIYRIVASLLIFIVFSGSIFYYFYRSGVERKENTALIAAQFFLPEDDEFLNKMKLSLDVQRNAIENNNRNVLQDNYTPDLIRQSLLLIEAVSDIENADIFNARKKLEELYNTNYPQLKPAALWYYAILQAKEGKYKEASKLLNKLSNDNNYYSSAADSLLMLFQPD